MGCTLLSCVLCLVFCLVALYIYGGAVFAISNRLYIGTTRSAANLRLLQSHGIDRIVSLSDDHAPISFTSGNVGSASPAPTVVHITASTESDLSKVLSRLVALVKRMVDGGHTVLIASPRCQQRAPTLAAVYLARCCDVSVDDAVQHIRNAKPDALQPPFTFPSLLAVRE